MVCPKQGPKIEGDILLGVGNRGTNMGWWNAGWVLTSKWDVGYEKS